MSETTTKAPKAKTEYVTVKMNDGREVQFPTKRKITREVLETDGKVVGMRFNYVNGESRSLHLHDLHADTVHQLAVHGISQKVGDEASSGTSDIDDIVLSHENMIERLKKGEFYAERSAGDSFAGAASVVQALCEVTGKGVEEIKGFLNRKLESLQAAAPEGTKVSRHDLYASFKKPGTKTGEIIERIEKEKRAKEAKFDADELVAEAEAMA